MLRKEINYKDYNGVERKETFYFHLNKAEIVRMQMGIKGGLTEQLKQILATQNTPEIYRFFEDLIQKSYGIKTPNGGFMKKPEYLEEFMSTEAYSELIIELLNDDNKASEFFNGIMPVEVKEGDVQAFLASNGI